MGARPRERRDMDEVCHPDHYASGGIECIDAIRAAMSKDEFIGFLRGNILKYIWREDKKGSQLQDLEKAGWYLEKLKEEIMDEREGDHSGDGR